MNLVLLFPEDRVAEEGRSASQYSTGDAAACLASDGASSRGLFRLTGRRRKHVQEIHRAEVGEKLTVGLLDGRVGHGTIVALDEDHLDLEVHLDTEPPPPLLVTLLLALPRPPVVRRVLIAATSMGVKRIVLMNANAVEKSFWQSRALREEALTEQLVLGLEQARDTRMPEVLLRPRFRPFIEDELPRWSGLRLVAHPGLGVSCPGHVEEPVLLAIGPESGWTAYELEKLNATGFREVSLGPRSLRVETVVPALLAHLG